MSKRDFDIPFVNASVLPTGESGVIGPGSGTGTPDDDVQFDFEMWAIIMADFPEILDANGDGVPGTYADYVAWWNSHENWEKITP